MEVREATVKLTLHASFPLGKLAEVEIVDMLEMSATGKLYTICQSPSALRDPDTEERQPLVVATVVPLDNPATRTVPKLPEYVYFTA